LLHLIDWSFAQIQKEPGTTLYRLPALVIATFLAVASAPMPAIAHAELSSSTPSQGATVATLPETVKLVLSEPARKPAFVSVENAAGNRVNSQTVRVLDNEISTPVLDRTQAGKHTMSYRIVSVDGHVVSGTINFDVKHGVAEPTPTPSAAAAEASPNPTPSPGETDAAIEPQSDDAASWTEPVTVVGFAVLAMLGLFLVIRAGLRANTAEDSELD
jgi:methionine-rich copper-binding protein CopC